MYDLEAMRNVVKKCDDNIKVFEKAIDGELETKREYQKIVRDLEDKLRNENRSPHAPIAKSS